MPSLNCRRSSSSSSSSSSASWGGGFFLLFRFFLTPDGGFVLSLRMFSYASLYDLQYLDLGTGGSPQGPHRVLLSGSDSRCALKAPARLGTSSTSSSSRLIVRLGTRAEWSRALANRLEPLSRLDGHEQWQTNLAEETTFA